MSTKPQTTGPNPTIPAPAKQARSRKAANPDAATTGRAGSAGGVVLEKEASKKPSTPTSAPATAAKATAGQPKEAPPKRKPRKLNKEPTSTSTAPEKGLSTAASELEALKSRVRGLEAKVEELYKSTPGGGGGGGGSGAPPRSPRRRGKGRKTSSATTTATLGNLARKKAKEGQQGTAIDDEEEADEELDRLESELEVARQHLALYNPGPGAGHSGRPRARRAGNDDAGGDDGDNNDNDNDNDEDVEEVPRKRPGLQVGSDRQVTLSGSYRIPLPATLNPEDVKTIQSGVTAAQNVARSFLDQRRASQALRNAQADAGPPPSTRGPATNPNATAKTRASSATEQGVDVSAQETGAGKQSWGEWIGGYSMAISRAVKNIEHEAAMEAQRPGQTRTTSAPKASAGAAARRKRPAAKTTLSGEQVEGLMS
ncbi:hypothetical protein SVAN01_09640 [Stagonosporopsis vannaccii]|nr:hypothetical protein SVAN01_09640 [Stagonosporopsis vannaccii]